MKYTFVILHYQNIDDTINCVESIKKLEKNISDEIKLIVIDNKSPNDSGEVLKDKYKNKEQIEVILLDKNYGFSKANNIGYEKARKEKTDVILVINNDIVFEDKSFLIKLEKIIVNNNSDIICPDIINIDNKHQNPMKKEEMTIRSAYKNMIYEMLFIIIIYIPILRKYALKWRNNREKKWFEKYYDKNNEIKDCTRFVPHGAFIIYTNNWLKKEQQAFVSDTFMYAEEDMLSLYIKQKKYKMFYANELKVRHLEGQSTKKSNKNEYKNNAFKSKNKAKALRKYIKFYKKIS